MGSLSNGKFAALAVALLLLGGGVGSVVQQKIGPNQESVVTPSAVDIGFLRDMMLHHEQAIELSLLELNRGDAPDVRQEAVDILLAQRGEYVQMGDQLDKWGVDPVNPDGTVMGWMGMSMPAASMPGLATPAQIATFKAATGTAADAQFVQLMITHHVGGVQMADVAKRQGQSQLVVEMASRMSALQTTEIAEMKSMALRLGVTVDTSLPAHDMDHSSDTDVADVQVDNGSDDTGSDTPGTTHDMSAHN
jgi:uncharacterized protein (DUF305 family)